VESEFSAISSVAGAVAAGSRAFTATCSQGLALMHEVLFAIAGMRLPVVMVVANRALSAPINIWCFSKDANVLMGDLTYKPISEIKEGDVVLGKDKKGNLVFTKVKRTFKRKTDKLVKLKTDKFDLICTPEHKFYYRPGHRHWTKASNLKEKRLHWFGYGFEFNDEFKRGWLAGMSDGDGCFYFHSNRFNFRLKVKDKKIVDTFISWANQIGFPVRRESYLEKEGYFIASMTLTDKTKEFNSFLQKFGDDDFCRGYLAGVFDAEGTGPFKVKQAVIYNNNPEILSKVFACLKRLKLKFKKYVDKRSVNYHVKINNVPEFFVKCRPILERKRGNIRRMTLKSVKSRLKILDVIPLNENIEVYNLETDTNNYIVNGFLVHNCDHQDSITERDSGWIQLYVETAQEAVDTMIQAYKIAEDMRVLLPVMVCMDGFILTHTVEPVNVPDDVEVNKFLPKYKPTHALLDPTIPMTLGPFAYPEPYFKLRKELSLAIDNSKKIIKKINEEFGERFKRKYGNGLIEEYKNNKRIAIVSMGSVCGTVRCVVDSRNDTGLVKIRCYRPFPKEDLVNALKEKEIVIVLEKNISLGLGSGSVFSEVRDALYYLKEKPKIVGAVVGLGGTDVRSKDINALIDKAKMMKDGEVEWFV